MSKLACPKCGALTIREGASKCSACKAWIGPKPPKPLEPKSLFIGSIALISAGAIAGSIGTCIATPSASSAVAVRPTDDATSTPPAGSASSHAAGAGSGTPAASAALRPFGEPKAVRVECPPVDVVIGDDDATLYVLCEDASVRVVSFADAKENRKVQTPGRAAELRFVGGKYVALVGTAGHLALIDTTTWAVQRVDVGGTALDVAELEDGSALVVVTSTRKLVRVLVDGLRAEGAITLQKPVGTLSTAKVNGHEVLVAFAQGRRAPGTATIEVFDPKATPIVATRPAIAAGSELRRGGLRDPGSSVFAVDRAQGDLIEFPLDDDAKTNRPPRSAPIGKTPIGAFRLAGHYAVAVDLSGSAYVFDTAGATLAAKGTLALGGGASDAALTPDGRTLLVALGGGGRERGPTTAIIGGDPPNVLLRATTGAGSHAVNVSKSGRVAAVAAYWARSIAVFERK